MISDPIILCWQPIEHHVMLIIAAVSLVTSVVPVLALIAIGTLMHGPFLAQSTTGWSAGVDAFWREQIATGFYVTPFELSLLFKVAAEVDRYEVVFEDCLDGIIMMPHETVTCVCILARNAESKFLRFAEEVAKHCREKCMMSIAVYSALMKVYA